MSNASIPNFARPLTTVDLAILSIQQESLQVLLVKRPSAKGEPFPDLWALPGGFIDLEQDDDLESCASRKLKEKTGVATPYLEQVGTWGNAQRDPRGWSTTTLYFALIAADAIPLVPGGNTDAAKWTVVEGNKVREKLAFDHAELLKAAVNRLRSKVEYTSLPAFLMPNEFTLTELQRVYEITLDRSLEKKAFRTRVLATDLLEEVPRRREGANRPAQLFKLKSRKRAIYFARALSGERA
ncbi:MAG TPA: NUDIX domain-containing protein [Steroidobacteraceae bacterium]|nr:NUDIX domain-containing protein [Steroidobacteraceae bacterium]